MLHFAYDHLATSNVESVFSLIGNCPSPYGRFCAAWLPLVILGQRDRYRMAPTSELLSRGQLFIYPVELSGSFHGSFDAAPSEAPKLAQSVPEEVLRAVRGGRASILFSLGYETGYYRYEGHQYPTPDGGRVTAFDLVHDFIVRNGLPPHRVWFTDGNLSFERDAYEWMARRGVNPLHTAHFRGCEIVSSAFKSVYRLNREGTDLQWGFDVHQHDDRFGKIQMSTYRLIDMDIPFKDRYVTPREVRQEKERGSVRKFNFLSMNKHHHLHRQLLASFLSYHDLLEKGMVSYATAPFELNGVANMSGGMQVFADGWKKLHPKLPLTIDIGCPEASVAEKKSQNNFHLSFVGDAWPYRESYFNIVTETFYGAGIGTFLTEKIYKSVINMQPFIVVGTPFSLSAMQRAGFKTFSRRFDESYDAKPDDSRLPAILQLVSAIAQQDASVMRDIYFDLLPELEHNHYHMVEGDMPYERLLAEIGFQL